MTIFLDFIEWSFQNRNLLNLGFTFYLTKIHKHWHCALFTIGDDALIGRLAAYLRFLLLTEEVKSSHLSPQDLRFTLRYLTFLLLKSRRILKLSQTQPKLQLPSNSKLKMETGQKNTNTDSVHIFHNGWWGVDG